MKVKLATAILSGCFGCHVSLLDLDEKLLDLAEKVEVVYSPLVDNKTFVGVDLTIVEGAVSSKRDFELIKEIREKTKTLIAIGDCACNGNTTSLRNLGSTKQLIQQVYGLKSPSPKLLPEASPVHKIVQVDFYIPGCPPPSSLLYYVISELLSGTKPVLKGKFKLG